MLLPLLLYGGCAPPITGETVLLVSIDTWRADHLGVAGHPYVRTPHLDRLANEGLRFVAHYSAAPSTIASHTALLTGTWPHTHGAPRNECVVHPDNLTLAEVLSEAGYTTGAFIGGAPLAAISFLQGFSHTDTGTLAGGVERQDAKVVTDAALQWMRDQPVPKRFVFVHYYDVHYPYVHADYPDADTVSGTLADLTTLRLGLLQGDPAASARSRAMEARYASGVTYVDTQIGRLLGALDLAHTTVIVTADHGENFAEHAEEYWDHGAAVYPETIHTPLIVRQPTGEAGCVDTVVSNIDVMPTLLDLLGVPVPASVEGVSFAPVFRGETVADRPVFAEATKPNASPAQGWYNAGLARAVYDTNWFYIVDPRKNTTLLSPRSTPRCPGATPRPPTDGAHLAPALTSWSAAPSPHCCQCDVDATEQLMLCCLGYLSDCPAEIMARCGQ